jgi:hypothetical protein
LIQVKKTKIAPKTKENTHSNADAVSGAHAGIHQPRFSGIHPDCLEDHPRHNYCLEIARTNNYIYHINTDGICFLWFVTIF